MVIKPVSRPFKAGRLELFEFVASYFSAVSDAGWYRTTMLKVNSFEAGVRSRPYAARAARQPVLLMMVADDATPATGGTPDTPPNGDR